MEKLKACLPFAPIHNPNSYSVIEICMELLHDAAQFAVFDTSFHSQMPTESKLYALPRDLAEKYGFRKYGFHGLSYQYVSSSMAELLGKPLSILKLIICHLGTGGCSVPAIKDGESFDTSMGYSPLPGLGMSTRCGDLDPEIVLELIRHGNSAEKVSQILNNRSGLIGLSGYSPIWQRSLRKQKREIRIARPHTMYMRTDWKLILAPITGCWMVRMQLFLQTISG